MVFWKNLLAPLANPVTLVLVLAVWALLHERQWGGF